MKFKYLIAKYILDPKIHPLNIGVILLWEDSYIARFRGEREDGFLDEDLCKFAKDPINYMDWIDYWRETLRKGELEALLERKLGNYYIEGIGMRDSDRTDPKTFFEELYLKWVTKKEEPRRRLGKLSPEASAARRPLPPDCLINIIDYEIVPSKCRRFAKSIRFPGPKED